MKMSTWWGPCTVPYCTWNPGTDLLPRFTVRSWGSEGWNDSQSHIASKWQRKGFQTQILWLQSVRHSTFQSLPAGVEDPDRSPQSYVGFLMRAQWAHRQKGRGSKGLIRTCCVGPGWAARVAAFMGGAKGLVSAPTSIKRLGSHIKPQHRMATRFYDDPFSPKEGILGVWFGLTLPNSLLDLILTVPNYYALKLMMECGMRWMTLPGVCKLALCPLFINSTFAEPGPVLDPGI